VVFTCFPWTAQRSQPGFLLVLASRLSTGAFCWLSWSITTSLSNTSQQPHNHGDSNPWPFSRSRLAVDVRQHGLPSGCPLPLWISSPLIYLIFLPSSTSEPNGQSSSPEHVPSLRLLCSSVIFCWHQKKTVIFFVLLSQCFPSRVTALIRDALPMFHPEFRCVALFCGSSLYLVVLAGLLPQVTTYNHCFTIISLHLTPTSSHLSYA